MDFLIWYDKTVPGVRVMISDQAKGLVASLAKRDIARQLVSRGEDKVLNREAAGAAGEAVAEQLNIVDVVTAVGKLEEREELHLFEAVEGEETDDENEEEDDDVDPGGSLVEAIIKHVTKSAYRKKQKDEIKNEIWAWIQSPIQNDIWRNRKKLLDSLRIADQQYTLADCVLIERYFVIKYLKTH
ncbi:MAG: hypothetical protein Q9187_006865 [Circinaria calcarea]